MMQRHRLAATRNAGLFLAGAGSSCALLLWGVAAGEFMEPVALYEGLALGSAGVAGAGALAFGAALAAQHRADARAREGR